MTVADYFIRFIFCCLVIAGTGASALLVAIAGLPGLACGGVLLIVGAALPSVLIDVGRDLSRNRTPPGASS